jgi:ceramide glucosyltransferase
MAVIFLMAALSFSISLLSLELVLFWRISKRRFPEPKTWPAISILKPMCGLEEELEENLESHLKLDYPGDWEILLGVRSPADAAWPIAQAFAQKYPGRVRAVVQEGEPGYNPKVNQLITLTRYAKYDVLAVSDANVRVPANWLRVHAAILAKPGIGLSTNIFSGTGEQNLGAAIDNMTLASFCGANIAGGELLLGLTQVVGKSFALARTTLAAIGGWEDVKDLLAEDQRMGFKMVQAKFGTHAAPVFVENVQKHKPLSHFWLRHTRWAMLRYRVIPGYWLEPLLNPVLWASLVFAFEPSRATLVVLGGTCAYSIIFTELCSRIVRGRGVPLKWVPFILFRDVLMVLAWARGATVRSVDWRGNKLRVGKKTLLSPLEPDHAPRQVASATGERRGP